MVYKNKEDREQYYYKNREKRILYQREYDKKNKEKKNKQDKKRYGTKRYNEKQKERSYSQRVYFPILLKKYGGCQVCNSKQKLEIHHKKYKRGIKNCMIICKKCHKILHRKINPKI